MKLRSLVKGAATPECDVNHTQSWERRPLLACWQTMPTCLATWRVTALRGCLNEHPHGSLVRSKVKHGFVRTYWLGPRMLRGEDKRVRSHFG
jgi:hypothetical protein